MERTLSIIKPNAVERHVTGRIITRIEEDGLNIIAAKIKTLTQGEAEGFYAEHKGKPFFESLVKFMTSGPVMLMVLEAPDAIEKYRKLMGATNPKSAAPQTIRQIFGESIEANAVHGSDSPGSALREVNYFFEGEL